MIIKPFELEKIDLKKNNIFLFYGENQGYKSELIEKKFKKLFPDCTYNYDEGEILRNKENFFNEILSRSFFDNEKLIIISRTTDKIKDLIQEIIEKKIEDIVLVLNSAALEKKSKLRIFFEKDRNIICIPFYEDNYQTLNSIISLFFRNKKISISQQLTNILIERCRGDRKNLTNELTKIESFSINKKNISAQEIIQITNLADNYNASELIDHSLAKNTRKTLTILNENNYSDEDNIVIIRTLLTKLKRLVKIYELVDEKNNIEQAITIFKPPIFWKDKPLVIQQIRSWQELELKKLLYEANTIEYLIKKNSTIAKNILSDFIINNSKKVNS